MLAGLLQPQSKDLDSQCILVLQEGLMISTIMLCILDINHCICRTLLLPKGEGAGSQSHHTTILKVVRMACLAVLFWVYYSATNEEEIVDLSTLPEEQLRLHPTNFLVQGPSDLEAHPSSRAQQQVCKMDACL